ncbi:hypothetical protein AXF42_Ash010852 [Apostasia shenzhenica]|uniref:Uncharacterized protein n=1 Tax=Apostasia shenzhenica TaxID=1088818 RepID=A0A2I0A0U8_9ASPA|nr:hypothetical protein AXF42_Ash010852 [Apostasia shenzhenica]
MVQEMEGESKKRGRSEARAPKLRCGRSPEWNRKRAKEMPKEAPDIFSDYGGELLEVSETYRPLGVFEFPWQNEPGPLAIVLDGCDLRDVFFSSLVDGCSAAIGFPGDRFTPPVPSGITLPADADESWPLDKEADGADCIWTSALRQPLSNE